MLVVLRPDPLPEIEQLYRAELVRFVRVARAIVGDEQAARDVVQEAFTRAVEKRSSFRRRGPLEAWLWRIVVNEARKRAAAVAPAAYAEKEPSRVTVARRWTQRFARRSLRCRSGNGLPCSCATTPIWSTRRSPRHWGSSVAPQAQVSFGIAADGVRGLDLSADDGDHTAIVASNAFLYVDDKPKVGTRVRKVFAIDSNGDKSAVPFQSAPFGEWDRPTPAHDRPTGPSTVQRKVDGGTIGWVMRREDRGEEPPKDAPYMRAAPGRGLEFARLITPDPDSQMRMLVGIGTPPFGPRPEEKGLLCGYLIVGGGAGGGCSPLKAMFSGDRAPFYPR
jgi:hypothetical protein